MAAIGSQYDPRPDAKTYSLTLLEIATKLLRRRDNIGSRSRLADLQTVFLLEVLSKYCSRRSEVEMSARFRSLFASLDQARRSLATDPLAVFKTLRKDRTPEDIARAHKFWVDHETRRRILQASSVLDLQQVTLFEQPATIVQHDRPRRSGPGLRCNTFLPCSEELWESSPVEAWVEAASSPTSPDTSKPRSSRRGKKTSSSSLDYFQTTVLLANNPGFSLPQVLEGNNNDDERTGTGDEDAAAATPRLRFNHHMWEMARNTPIRALLVVSGESWILGKKLENESEFQDAKRNLRVWIDANVESRTAFWHATQLIRSRVKIGRPSPAFESDSFNTELSVSVHDTHMLHEPWAFYLAALVCWAYGFSAARGGGSGHVSGAASAASEPHSNLSRTSGLSRMSAISAHPALLDAQEAAYSAREYLQATDVAQADDLLPLESSVFAGMDGLLEVVRLHKVGLSMGGLMNEAERVLYRLVEGRSRMSHF
jgi:hypothetical protein